MKDIEGYEGLYAITEGGKIWSYPKRGKHKGIWLRPFINTRTGYPCVELLNRPKPVHRLVAITFIPNSRKLPEVNHKNGNKLDFSIQNLEWVTRSENIVHAFRTGLMVARKGTEVHTAKLDEEKVREIRLLYQSGDFTYREIGEMFGVYHSVISNIINGHYWKHVS